MPQLSIQIEGHPEQRVRIDEPCTLRDGDGSDLGVEGLEDILISVTPLAIGLVLEASAPFGIGPRRIRPGVPRLLRNGERATFRSAVLRAIGDPSPEATRELAAAMLAGLDPVPIDGPSLIILEGPGAGRRFPMGSVTRVGRGVGADVPLADPLVSREHLELRRAGPALLARALPTKNGVAVNGRRVRRRRFRIRRGDELRVGSTLLMFEEPDPPDQPPPEPRRDHPSFRAEPVEARAGTGRATVELVAIGFASLALLAAALLLVRAAG